MDKVKTHNSVLKSVASEAFLADLPPAQETFSWIPHLLRGSRSLLTWGKAGVNVILPCIQCTPKISEKAGCLWGLGCYGGLYRRGKDEQGLES